MQTEGPRFEADIATNLWIVHICMVKKVFLNVKKVGAEVKIGPLFILKSFLARIEHVKISSWFKRLINLECELYFSRGFVYIITYVVIKY